MILLPYLSVIRVTGLDAVAFLQSQLSADIAALDDGGASFAAYCSPRGQVLGLLLVCRSGNGFFLIAASDLMEGIVMRLRIYVMRSKVDFGDAPGLNVFGIPPDESPPEGCHRFNPAPTSLEYAVGSSDSPNEGESSVWKSQELLQGVAWLDERTRERFIPQMLGQDAIGALSFTKGCYPGQEIVARTRYLGKVKRKPLVVTVGGRAQIENGSSLTIHYAGESVNGTLIDSAGIGADTVLFIVTNLLENELPEKIVADNLVLEVV